MKCIIKIILLLGLISQAFVVQADTFTTLMKGSNTREGTIEFVDVDLREIVINKVRYRLASKLSVCSKDPGSMNAYLLAVGQKIIYVTEPNKNSNLELGKDMTKLPGVTTSSDVVKTLCVVTPIKITPS